MMTDYASLIGGSLLVTNEQNDGVLILLELA
jgi:hypothetical protein